MERIHIRPRRLTSAEAERMGLDPSGSLHVLDPVTGRALPVEGFRVVPSTYWFKRLREGSVEEISKASERRAPRARKAEEGVTDVD